MFLRSRARQKISNASGRKKNDQRCSAKKSLSDLRRSRHRWCRHVTDCLEMKRQISRRLETCLRMFLQTLRQDAGERWRRFGNVRRVRIEDRLHRLEVGRSRERPRAGEHLV